MSRTRAGRVLHEFDDVRGELLERMRQVAPDEFDWVPRPGMKSIRAQLDEIGRMEKIVLEHVKTGTRPSWEDALTWPGDSIAEYISVLDQVRDELKEHITGMSDSDLDHLIKLPEKWVQYWKVVEMAREEYLRWIIRHEYYHVGQVTVLLWILGKNPYDES